MEKGFLIVESVLSSQISVILLRAEPESYDQKLMAASHIHQNTPACALSPNYRKEAIGPAANP